MEQNKQHRKHFFAIFLGALFLLIPAFFNHYPLVNPDTATYLASGFKPETPFDRPITYGLLVRLFSLNGLSLWLVVLAQALIVSWLIVTFIKNILGDSKYLIKSFVTILFLSLFTSLSWIVSQVQPDVFTSIGFLCLVLLLINKVSKKTKVTLYVLFFIAVAVHLSHPLLFSMTLFALFILKRSFADQLFYKSVNVRLSIFIVLSLSSLVLMGSALSKSKHVFFMGSLLEKGVLKKYLDAQCATCNYRLCAYKDALPTSADYFWWDPGSPLYKVGDWQGSKPEFNQIIHNILTDPYYLRLYLTASWRQALVQARTNNIGDGNFSFPPGSNVQQRIQAYFPHETKQFNNSVQNNRDIQPLLKLPNYIFSTITLLSLLLVVISLVNWKSLPKELKVLLVVGISGIIFNYLDCAAFTVVNGRYGCKMIWLIPFCAMMFLMLQPARKIFNTNTITD